MPIPASGPKRTILVVDDTPSTLSVINNLLKDEYHVKVATCGMRGLELARAAPPDLMLLDVLMPDIDGYALCRELKSQQATRGIPIIFLTARSDPADEERGLMLGAVDYIAKPISPPVVLARIRTQLQLQGFSERLQQLVQMHTAEREFTRDQSARIQRAALDLGRQRDYQATLDAALRGAVSILQCDTGALFVVTDHDTLQLVTQIPELGPLHAEIRLTDPATKQANLLDACARSLHLRSTLLLDNVTQDMRENRVGEPGVDNPTRYQTVSMLVVPVATQNGSIAAVMCFTNLMDLLGGRTFDARGVPFIEEYAAQVGAALGRHALQHG